MNYTPQLQQHGALFPTIGQWADALHLESYVVGGFVRDLLLGRSCKDIDIVCVGDAAELAAAFAKTLPNTQPVYFKNFGTAMVRWGDYQVEFVGSRKESYQPHSRKPAVAAGTLQDDILRRDFTINTLAIRLNQDHFGTLIDLCQGRLDLQSKIIRTPKEPEQTFSDDPLRILRAIRFATQLHCTIEPATAEALTKTADRVAILSKERIAAELNKILLTDQPDKGFFLLDYYGIMPYILPEMVALKGVETINGLSHKDNFFHTLQVLKNVAQTSTHLWLRWAALLHDIAKPPTKRFDPKIGFTFHGHERLGAKMADTIFRRLGLPLQELRYVKKLINLHLRHIPLVENEVTDAAVRRYIHDAGDTLEDLILLCRADITSQNDRKVRHYLANFEKLAEKINTIEAKDYVRNLQPVVTGEVIMKTFGLPPSKPVGIIRNAVKEAILDGLIPNQYPQAYDYMLAQGKALGLTPKNS